MTHEAVQVGCGGGAVTPLSITGSSLTNIS